jgi:antitoxin (DNA-binding transcriptional repressor) of toxin-antitoxin stability system
VSEELKVRDFTREPSTYIDRVLGGESFVLTRYGKEVALLTGTTTSSSAITTQVEHEATDARHRPAPEPLEVWAHPTSWADRNPKAAATDAILGAARGRKRE